MFLTVEYLVLVMEYAAGGDLLERVKGKGQLTEDEARWFFQQIMFAMSYCHGMVRGPSPPWGHGHHRHAASPLAACLPRRTRYQAALMGAQRQITNALGGLRAASACLSFTTSGPASEGSLKSRTD